MKKRKTQNLDQSSSSPPWEDLNPHLLSMVFSWLTLQNQLSGPPLVCRAWLSATLTTLFHNSVLDLRLIDNLRRKNQRSRFVNLLKLAIDNYDGWVAIYFQSKYVFGYFAVVYIAERTPKVSSVLLSSDDHHLIQNSTILPVCISLLHWRNLRVFHARMMSPDAGFVVLTQLADFCENLVELSVHGRVTERQVVCIVEGFPRLRVLDLSMSCFYSKSLGILLGKKSKYLKEINLLHCMILDDDDGKDIHDRDGSSVRTWRRQMLGKASNLQNLNKFLHCFEKPCKVCRDVLLRFQKDTAK